MLLKAAAISNFFLPSTGISKFDRLQTVHIRDDFLDQRRSNRRIAAVRLAGGHDFLVTLSQWLSAESTSQGLQLDSDDFQKAKTSINVSIYATRTMHVHTFSRFTHLSD